jgi:hypothetical protein
MNISAKLSLAVGLWLGPLGSQAQQIACGQTITNTINSPGQTTLYTFDANAGETLDVLALGQNFNATAEVYGPSEDLLASCTNNFTGPLALTASGTCSIRVRADNLVSTGTYGISLMFLTGRCGSSLVWGRPVTNAITRLAEVDLYTFSGNAGETVELTSYSGNFAVASFVSSPTGAIVANWLNGLASLNLTTTGTYTVGVYSFYFAGTGAYSLNLSFTRLVPASYKLAVGMTNRATALGIRGQVGRLTTLQFTPSLGTSQWFTLTNFSLPCSPCWLVDWDSTNSPRRFYRSVQ